MISTSTVRTALTVIEYEFLLLRESLSTGDTFRECQSSHSSNEGHLQAGGPCPGSPGRLTRDLEQTHAADPQQHPHRHHLRKPPPYRHPPAHTHPPATPPPPPRHRH